MPFLWVLLGVAGVYALDFILLQLSGLRLRKFKAIADDLDRLADEYRDKIVTMTEPLAEEEETP